MRFLGYDLFWVVRDRYKCVFGKGRWERVWDWRCFCVGFFGLRLLFILVVLLVIGSGLFALSFCSRGRVRSRMCFWGSRLVYSREATVFRVFCRVERRSVGLFRRKVCLVSFFFVY